jgi:hypothetical protein
MEQIDEGWQDLCKSIGSFVAHVDKVIAQRMCTLVSDGLALLAQVQDCLQSEVDG